jgi:YjbE family integral membrane protein
MVDLGWFGWISLNAHFFTGLGTIILINIILSGDNAVLIALAVRGLEPRQRTWGIILGSMLAVILRIGLTAFAVTLLNFAFLKVVGGALIAWIAVKLLTEDACSADVKQSCTLWGAVRVILIADLVMSIDNVLAIAGAAKGNMFLIILGLGTSIPLVVGTSAFLTILMERYPIIVTFGAGVLGKVSGEMIITDPWVHQHLNPTHAEEIGVQIFFLAGVILVGTFMMKWRKGREVVQESAEYQKPLSS